MSAVGNWSLYGSLTSARERATQAEASRDAFKTSASSCSAWVSKVKEAADRAEKNARAGVAAAEEKARRAQNTADKLLAAKPPVPGDDCRSAQELAREWLRGRR